MPDIYFKSVPFSKEDVTLALESGVDGIITDAEHVEGVRSLALCDVRAEEDMPSVGLGSKADEESIASRIAGGERLVLAQGWEIIPVENLLAQPAVAGKLAVEAAGRSPSCGGGSRMRRARRGGAPRSSGKPQEYRIGAEIVARHAVAG